MGVNKTAAIFEQWGWPKWDIVVSLAVAWLLIFFVLMGGIKSSGKVRPLLYLLDELSKVEIGDHELLKELVLDLKVHEKMASCQVFKWKSGNKNVSR